MFTIGKANRASNELEAKVAALGRSMGVIEFNLDGTVITANENFLAAVGYGLPEITGKHHSIFVDPAYAKSADYRQFWDRLNRGEFVADKFRRISKSGKDVWIQASYNPLLDAKGKPFKVIKFATDVTAVETQTRELEAKMAAISRSQAVIEFNLDGTVITANENFLAVVGYRLAEVVGKHHSIFVDPAYAKSADYRQFWDRLNRGEFVADKFRRISKSGKDVWIQASYNPLLDANGKPFKVIKFATDVTAIEDERRHAEEERAHKSVQQTLVVDSLGSGLRQLSEGNLTFRVTESFSKEYEQLRADFNAAMSKMQETLKGIVQNADAVRAGAAEIAGASDDLSKRTEQQAASLEETTAALNEITSTVKKTADGSRKASDTVGTARGEAEHSGQIVQQAIDAMRQIEDSARKVSQIIGVIDEIAFQTNLLALNAGVEAARAGDAGRGFAVVASEVRALAQRSAEAAKEIKALILTSSQQVESGAKLVGETGNALGRIVGRVNEISTLVNSIAAGAEQQATGLSQINTAIMQMDQGTQQNAAMVEESTAAVHALSKEADAMANLMAGFSIGASDGDSLRSQLEHAAPHAFRQRGHAPAAGSRPHLASSQKHATPRPGVERPRKTVAGGGANDGWEEF
ncbi:methyl-accepting chemotaxis protein [Hyphomicrobium sp. 2TAF46]|uniref:methyl-accepting chemotaxis protein n=1 Tax=Hyphomicrobium sp. 2TAF46 TaxID=3233019 RepID=UPI003F8EFC26